MGRVVVHIDGARGWLERAAGEWERGQRARAVLDLSLAEAEVRLARYAALTEPPSGRRRKPAWALVAVAALAAALAGALRWPTGTAPERSAAHALPRAVSLGYVPGGVLALVAPPGEGRVGRPWTDPSAEDPTLWLRGLFREGGADPEGFGLQPASLR